MSGSRPLRPVKRKKLEDGSCGHSNTAPEHVKNANIGTVYVFVHVNHVYIHMQYIYCQTIMN